MPSSMFSLKFYDRDTPVRVEIVADRNGLFKSESLTRKAASSFVGAKPACLELFALKSGNGYLSPNHDLSPGETKDLELRVRFRLPTSSRLSTFDPATFDYFFRQTVADFRSGKCLPGPELASRESSSTSTEKTWFNKVAAAFGEEDEKSDESVLRRNERVTFLSNVLKLACLTMMVEIKNGEDKKHVLKNFETYLPKRRLWTGMPERLLGLKQLRPAAEKLIENWMKEERLTSTKIQTEFLDCVAEFFPHSCDETFESIWLRKNGFAMDADKNQQNMVSVRLTLSGPVKSTSPPYAETEPKLLLEELKQHENGRKSKNRTANPVTQVCAIDEICFISIIENDTEHPTRTLLSRKNGIPMFFQFCDRFSMLQFISALSGYYRLCEKWSFALCSETPFPSLEFLSKFHIHGPVSSVFVESKLVPTSEQGPKGGTYLIRMCPEELNRFYLHYIPGRTEGGGRSVTVVFHRLEGDRFQWNEKFFDDFTSMIRVFKTEFDLQQCLHPSEFDKCLWVLLCRSSAKLEEDILGSRPSDVTQLPHLIPINTLKKIENRIFNGKFTNVWKGRWEKCRGVKEDVSIKQLKVEFASAKLVEFMENCVVKACSWEDSSLVKIFGAMLPFGQIPMALVTEYFSHGPLNVYLQKNQGNLDIVNLVESSATLARALWYLEQNLIVHSNIRCRNVFVSRHEGDTLTVKLGDAGIPDYSEPSEIHFLAPEMFADLDYKNCTTKGDVWAFGTTMWQIFSYGVDPLVGIEPQFARMKYLSGERLSKPDSLSLSIYEEIMLPCWRPHPDDRKTPREIMREMNKFLYRVVNSKRVHTYLDIDRHHGSFSSNATTTASITTAGSYRFDYSQPLTSEVEVSMAPTLPPKNLPQGFWFDCEKSEDQFSLSNVQVFGSFEGDNYQDRDIFDRSFSRRHRESDAVSFNSNAPLITCFGESRSSSSMAGSLFTSYLSQGTAQTSLASYSGPYSMSSIYQLSHDSQLELNKEFALGEGNFGVVYRGVLQRSNGEWDQVAVKMLKNPGLSSQAADELHRELEIMRGLNHDNVVKIKAVLSDEGMIIMEYLSEGSLDRFIHANRDRLRFPNQFFIYAQNILDGMEYLTKKGIIHRDLAARNILVASEDLVKISDFGLARLIKDEVYVMSTQTNIPVKWLALECLKHNVYSMYSDIWSFGVVLWEMWTFGNSPFLEGCEGFFQVGATDEKLGDDIQTWIQKLEDGARLPMPEKCSSLVYTDLMLPCWNIEPKRRPDFTELKLRLKKIELQVT